MWLKVQGLQKTWLSPQVHFDKAGVDRMLFYWLESWCEGGLEVAERVYAVNVSEVSMR